jgi:hypothetical protein
VASAVIQDLTGHYAPATINRSLGALKKALGMAWERGRTSVDYSSLVKRVAENNQRTVYLDMAQVKEIADHASENVRAAIWVSLLTGCRRGEVCKIEAEDIGADTDFNAQYQAATTANTAVSWTHTQAGGGGNVKLGFAVKQNDGAFSSTSVLSVTGASNYFGPVGTAFQQNAFQSNAFQIFGGATSGGGTVNAAFSAAATASVTGVGAATASGTFSSSSVSAVTGTGASVVSAAGSITSAATVTGISNAIGSAAFSAASTATLTGVGAATASGAFSAAGTATLTGVGAATQGAAASDTNTTTLTGVGAATAAAAASAGGVLTLTGEGAASAAGAAAGSITITSGMTGVGAAAASAAAGADAVLTLTGVGSSQAPNIVSADGSISIVGALTGVGAATAGAAASAIMVGNLYGDTGVTVAGNDTGGKKRKRRGQIDLDRDEEEMLEIAALLVPLLGGSAIWAR